MYMNGTTMRLIRKDKPVTCLGRTTSSRNWWFVKFYFLLCTTCI